MGVATPEQIQEALRWKEETKQLRNVGEQYFLEIPGDPESAPDKLHLDRYKLAAQAGHETVLDAACGCGYGALILKPKFYLGLDINEYAIEYANRFVIPFLPEGSAAVLKGNIGFALPCQTASLDAVTSFETIEHVSEEIAFTNPYRPSFAQEVMRVLKPGGTWYASTPLTGARPELVSKYHVREYKKTEFVYYVEKAGFKVKRLLWHDYRTQLLQDADATLPETSDLNNIIYIVAVAEKSNA